MTSTLRTRKLSRQRSKMAESVMTVLLSTQAHIKKNRSNGMALKVVNAELLVIVWYELHRASPPSQKIRSLMCSAACSDCERRIMRLSGSLFRLFPSM